MTSIFASSPPWLCPISTTCPSAGSAASPPSALSARCSDSRRRFAEYRDGIAGGVGEHPELEMLADRGILEQVVHHVRPAERAGRRSMDQHDRHAPAPVRLDRDQPRPAVVQQRALQEPGQFRVPDRGLHQADGARGRLVVFQRHLPVAKPHRFRVRRCCTRIVWPAPIPPRAAAAEKGCAGAAWWALEAGAPPGTRLRVRPEWRRALPWARQCRRCDTDC